MLILGVDPSSRSTGYGLIETGANPRLLTYGALRPPPRASAVERLQHIHAGLCTLLAELRPQQAVVEEVFHAANTRTALVLGQVRGVTLLALAQAGCVVSSYSPAEVKKSVAGHGRADKREMQAMVRLLLRLANPPEPDDAADAVALALCHAQTLSLRSALERAQAPRLPRPGRGNLGAR